MEIKNKNLEDLNFDMLPIAGEVLYHASSRPPFNLKQCKYHIKDNNIRSLLLNIC